MARDAREAALVLHRFGFGPRAGSIAAIAADPRAALLAELDNSGAGQITNPDLPASGAVNRAVFEFQAERNAKQKLARKEAEQLAMANPGKENTPEAATEQSAKAEEVPLPRQLFVNEARADRRRARREYRLCRAACVVLVEPLLCQSGEDRDGRRLRAGGDPATCSRPLPRHAARCRRPPGDADLPRQCAVDRPRLGRRRQSRQGAQRKSRT